MNFEQKYKDVIKMAREAYYSSETPHVAKAWLLTMFPEIAESEDKKIKKSLIRFLESPFVHNYITDEKVASWLDWLEKQGEKKPVWHNEDEEPKRGSLILLIMQSGTPIVAKIIEPNHTFNHGERWAYIDDLLEKQGEPEDKESDDELTWLKTFIEEEAYYLSMDIRDEIDRKKLINLQNALAWLEKQGEQKPADKVKPEFHEGDWVVNKLGDSWHIDSFDEENYQVSNGKGNYNWFPISKQDEMHLWTIQDAKDGDVLAFDNDTVVIFKDRYNSSTFHSYCHIEDGLFDVSKDDMPDWWEGKGFQPATKEQRDTLFAKIKEAGYKWNSMKKELKKVESKTSLL